MERALPLGRRFSCVVASAVLGFLGSPGILGQDGSALLAILGVALWAWAATHAVGERRWAVWLVEWLGGALAGGLLMWWVSYVVLGGVLSIGAGWGVYFVLQGALLRRVARRLPFPLAVAITWTGVESLRSALEPPFGLGWLRLGHYAHAELWLSGSARVAGVAGLTFVLAALAGGLAALALDRRRPGVLLASALVPCALALGAARLVRAPATVDGPRVLLVQPGFSQKRKQFEDAAANFMASRDLTARAAQELGPVDLVCWGESMLYVLLFSPAAEQALRSGTARSAPWDEALGERELKGWSAAEDGWVRGKLLGIGPQGERALPAGASLCAGAEAYDLVDGVLRRRVALVLYDAQGKRAPPAYKRHLVPLGETFFGLERFAWVRDLARSAAGYLPDFVAAEHTGVLELVARDGRRYSVSGSLCFDNAYLDPYVDALRQGPVDFHLVASNEAWYEGSCEMDQMVAFSRLAALSTGRSVVRATNSGISLVLAPDGRELGRVRGSDGSDRSVAGFAAWPVPVPAGEAGVTPFVRMAAVWPWLWIGLAVLGASLPRRAGNHGSRAG